MSNIPYISIIVPVYNVEPYLDQCVNSVILQTHTNWELILINDGSTDKSGEICDTFSKQDSRIKVYHTTNHGVSAARNYGLNNSSGDWIMFLDADDWLEFNTLEECVKYCNQYECIRFDMQYYINSINSYPTNRISSSWSAEEYLSKIISRQTILGVCAGMYRRCIFDQYNIKFNTDILLGEDWIVLYEIVKNTKRIKILDIPLYYYNQMNLSSAVHSFNLSKYYQLLEAATLICNDTQIDREKYSSDISQCKADICSQILVNVILSTRSMKIIKSCITIMKEKSLYPSISSLYRSNIPFKHKLVTFGGLFL